MQTHERKPLCEVNQSLSLLPLFGRKDFPLVLTIQKVLQSPVNAFRKVKILKTVVHFDFDDQWFVSTLQSLRFVRLLYRAGQGLSILSRAFAVRNPQHPRSLYPIPLQIHQRFVCGFQRVLLGMGVEGDFRGEAH